MFITLLLISLVLAASLAFVGLRLLRPSLRGILNHVVGVEAADHWFRFAVFSLYITSVGNGVYGSRLERYIQQLHKDAIIAPLTVDSWVFEIYQVIERTLSGLACGAITFFIISLICLVVLRVFQMRSSAAVTNKP